MGLKALIDLAAPPGGELAACAAHYAAEVRIKLAVCRGLRGLFGEA